MSRQAQSQKQSEIPRELDELDKNILDLENTIGELEGKLETTLSREENEDSTERPEANCSSYMGERLNKYNGSLCQAISTIGKIIRKCEL